MHRYPKPLIDPIHKAEQVLPSYVLKVGFHHKLFGTKMLFGRDLFPFDGLYAPRLDDKPLSLRARDCCKSAVYPNLLVMRPYFLDYASVRERKWLARHEMPKRPEVWLNYYRDSHKTRAILNRLIERSDKWRKGDAWNKNSIRSIRKYAIPRKMK